MIELIGYIPQTAQGVYKKDDVHYTISEPFQRFSATKLPEEVNPKQLGYTKQNAHFKRFPDLTRYLENLHMLEILMNKKMKAAQKLIVKVKESKDSEAGRIVKIIEDSSYRLENSEKMFEAVRVNGEVVLRDVSRLKKSSKLGKIQSKRRLPERLSAAAKRSTTKRKRPGRVAAAKRSAKKSKK